MLSSSSITTSCSQTLGQLDSLALSTKMRRRRRTGKSLTSKCNCKSSFKKTSSLKMKKLGSWKSIPFWSRKYRWSDQSSCLLKMTSLSSMTQYLSIAGSWGRCQATCVASRALSGRCEGPPSPRAALATPAIASKPCSGQKTISLGLKKARWIKRAAKIIARMKKCL